MSRRDLERRPHYVYTHTDADGAVVYVGRTVDPDRRPRDVDGRDWMKTEQTSVTISEPMPYAEACAREAQLIDQHHPKHNSVKGWAEPHLMSELEEAFVILGAARRHANYYAAVIEAMPSPKRERAAAIYIAQSRGESIDWIEPEPNIFASPPPA